MNRFRRNLCIIIVFSMTLCATAFASSDGTEKAKAYNDMKLLISLDVLQNHTINDSESMVSRIEFAKIIAKIAFPDDDYYQLNEKNYSDVADEYKNIVAALSAQKIMLGYDENTFRPEQPITYFEVIKALVSLTGYDFKAITAGGYPSGYVSCASDIGIVKDFNNRTDRELNFSEVSTLITNALKIDIVTMSFDGEKVSYNVNKDENLFSQKLNVYKSEGLFKATPETNIFGGAYSAPGYVLINDKTYVLADKTMETFLGHNVEFYYKADSRDSSDCRVLTMSDLKKTSTLTITSKEIMGYTNNKYSYCYDNESRENSAKISVSALILYNYRTPTTKTGDELYIPKEGKVNLIDNDGDNVYDVVFIWSYETYVVNDVSASAFIIGDYYGKDALNLDPDKVKSKIIKNDVEIQIESIEKWNILSVAKSDDSDPLVNIVVSDTRVTGKVDSYEQKSIFIDGKEYDLSSVFVQKNNVGQCFDFYLDFLGYVVVYDKNSASDYIFHGILTGYRLIDEFLETPPEFKIFTEDGVMTWYKTTKKIKLDNNKVESLALVDPENPSVLFDDIGIIPQMIAYKVNQNGEINFIDTVIHEPGEDEDSFNQSKFFASKAGSNYMLLGHTWNDEIAFASSTTIFKVPSDSQGKIFRGSQYEKYYEIQQWGPWNNPFFDHYDTYPVRFFNLNKTNVSDLMIYYISVNGEDSKMSELIVVKSIDQVLDKEDMVVMQVTGWKKSAEVIHVNVEAEKKDLFENIKPGDAIRYSLNKDGEIMKVKKALTVGEGDFTLIGDRFSQRTLYGSISSVDRDHNVILVKTKDEKGNDIPPVVNVLKGENENNGDVMKYYLKSHTMEKGEWSELRVGQEVIIDKNETAVRSIIIIER